MKKVTLLTAILVMLAGTTVMAQMGGRDCPKPPEAPGIGSDRGPGCCGVMQCREQLSLNDEQAEKIRQIDFDHRQQMIDIKAELEKQQLNKRYEMQSEAPSEDKILSLTREINSLRGKMAEQRVEHQFAIRAVLTKEQLEKWQDCENRCAGIGRAGHHRGSLDAGCKPGQRFRGHP